MNRTDLNRILDSSKLRALLSVSILLISFAHLSIRTFQNGMKGVAPWGFGEWLINYGGGYVRRGLFGEIFINTVGSSKNSLIYLALIQILIYLMIWIFMGSVLLKMKFSWFSMALICNPAAFTLSGWDIYVLARKESLGLLSLILLGYMQEKNSPKFNALFSIGIIFYVFSVFSSEVNLFFLPGISYMVLKKYSPINAKRILSLLYLFALVFVYVTINFHGNRLQKDLVCSKLEKNGINILNCDGAIDTLTITLSEAVTHLKGDYPANLLYFVFLLLGLLPLMTTYWFQENFKWIIALFAGILPLYFIAWDYGRWNYMFICQVTIVFVFSDKFRSEAAYLTKYRWTIYSAAPFILLWGVWHGGNPINNGLVGALFTTLRSGTSLFNSFFT